ncbi:hypothetical protein Tco_0460990 [Tanacetum coccineum]
MLDRTDFESWQQHIRLYCLGKDNGENIMKSINEGLFHMGTVSDVITGGTEGAFNRVQNFILQKHRNTKVHQKFQQTNIPVIPSTGVNASTEASGSKPRSNTKKNRILPAKKENKKKVEVHLRPNKTYLKRSQLSKIEPMNFKMAVIEDCWFQAMQDEIHEFDRLEEWDLLPRPNNFMVIRSQVDPYKEEGIDFEESLLSMQRKEATESSLPWPLPRIMIIYKWLFKGLKQDAKGEAPVGGVTIRDPVSKTTPKLPEVVGKGKAIVTKEQVAHSLIDLSKKKRTTDQFILVRRDQTPHDSTTGPSSQPKDDTSEKVIHESTSTSDSERTESETEAVAPKGDKDQGEVDSSTVTSGVSIPVSDPEKAHEALAGPDHLSHARRPDRLNSGN